MNEQNRQKIIDIIKEFVYDGTEITDESTSTDLILDSLDEVEIIMKIEKVFDVDLYEDIQRGMTVGELIDIVDKKI